MATKASGNTRTTNSKTLYRIIAITIVYVLLRFAGGSLGNIILYPIVLLVTFLHEFGHGMGAVLTGGSVDGLIINKDGSGVCTTLGGNAGVTLMGGYIGSAILGNIIFYIGAKMPSFHRITLALLGGLMLFVGVFWYQNIGTTAMLLIYAALLYFIATRANWPGEALMFFGLASVLYIIEDFKTGPKSDLANYAEKVGYFSSDTWKYVWLGIVVILFVYNLKLILNRSFFSKLF
jgi:hypothetical protein